MCINTGGEKVFPEEVESVLAGHPAVYDVTVVGVPDDRWGERVTAVVVVTGGVSATEDDLIAFCRGQLAGYKAPRAVVFVDSMQRSPVGKADYAWARARAVEAGV
jgi:acyl-CoA synthetase (AMP-forming)/AMP-acid ligase II